jgi:sarcosine oxidase
VLSDLSIEVHLGLALAAGAELHGHEKFLDWSKQGDLYHLVTDRATYTTKAVVVAAGAWAGKLLKAYGIPIRGDRQILGWFQPVESPELFSPQRLPVWIINSADLGHFYGFPVHGIPGLKVAKFFLGEVVDPDQPLLPVQRQEEESLRVFLRRFFPKADGPVTTLASMFFESTPDRDFVIDRLPGEDNFWIAAGFSGHGFKYVTAIGELLCDLVTTGVSSIGYDLTPFRIARFGVN